MKKILLVTVGNDNPKMTHCDHAKMTHPLFM